MPKLSRGNRIERLEEMMAMLFKVLDRAGLLGDAAREMGDELWQDLLGTGEAEDAAAEEEYRAQVNRHGGVALPTPAHVPAPPEKPFAMPPQGHWKEPTHHIPEKYGPGEVSRILKMAERRKRGK